MSDPNLELDSPWWLDEDASSVERYLVMPRMLDDSELSILARYPELRRRCRRGRRFAYRLMLREMRQQALYICDRHTNSQAPMLDPEEVAAFHRRINYIWLRLWGVYFLHGLGIDCGVLEVHSAVSAVIELFAAASA
jgi:hypothetical protein